MPVSDPTRNPVIIIRRTIKLFLFMMLLEHVNFLLSPHSGISVVTEKQTRTSRLLISKAEKSDSGNYTCSPSNSESASVLVHVLNGKLTPHRWFLFGIRASAYIVLVWSPLYPIINVKCLDSF